MTRPYRSGFCAPSNPADSHARCAGAYAGQQCSCSCHQAPSEDATRTPDAPDEGGVIAPGVYPDMPNADYHADRDYLSSSYLKSLLPEHYGPPPTDPAALDIGTVFHARVFGTPEDVVIVDAATWRGKDATAERDAAHARGAVPILAADSAMVDRMVARLRTHDEAMALIEQAGARHEVSCFTEDADGVRIKARFDLLAPVAVDLKSTRSDPLSTYDLTKAVIGYGYDLSAAHYLDVATRLGLDVTDFALVFVGKTGRHNVRVVALDDDFLARGRALAALAKHRHAYPAAVGAHPGAGGYLTLTPPAWAPVPEGIPA